MKLKNLLFTGLSFVLVATVAIGGTVAYLTSTDDDVNVMTLGNVKIEQHEYQRADGIAHDAGDLGAGNGVKEGALVPFVQGKKLYPAVPANNASTDYTAEATDLFFWGDYVYSGTAGNGLWNDNKLSNVMDKMVFVENTGKSDAYFRTIIAFECPEGMEYSEGSDKEFMMNTNGSTVYSWENIGYTTIDGVRYLVMVATYQNALKPGNQSHPSLLQVVMTHNATNEDMELLGDTYEILVVSQAVQPEGFANAETALDTAFGEITTTNHPWTNGVDLPTIATTTNELKNALKTKGETIVLTSGTYDMGGNFSIAEGVTLIGSENSVIKGTLTSTMKNITVKNVTFKGGNAQRWAYAKGNVVFENCTFDANSVYAIHYDGTSGADITYKNCDIIGWVAIAGGQNSLTFDGCRIFGNGTYGVIRTYSDTTIKNCTFDVDNVNTTDVYQDGIHAVDCTITVENCTNANGEIDALFNVSGTGKIIKK